MLKKRANAILTGRFIGNTFVGHRREFVDMVNKSENIGPEQYAKTCQAPKPIFLGLESEKSGHQIIFGKGLMPY